MQNGDGLLTRSTGPLRQWFLDVIRLYRERAASHGVTVPAPVSPAYDFSPPIRIQAVQVEDPDLALLIYHRDPTVEDKAVQVFGPQRAPHLVALVEEALRDPVWDLPAWDPGSSAELPGVSPPSRRDETLGFLAGLVKSADDLTLKDFERPSVVSWMTVSDVVSLSLVAGDLTELTPTRFVDRIFEELMAPKEAASQAPAGGTDGQEEDLIAVYVAAISPLTWIDRPPELRTLRDRVEGVRSETQRRIAIDGRFGGRRVIVYPNGVIAATATDRPDALRFYNTFFAMLELNFFTSRPISLDDLAEGKVRPDGALTSFTGTGRLTSIIGASAVYTGGEDRRIARAVLEGLISRAARLSLEPVRSLDLQLWLEGSSHFRAAEYSEALLYAWLVIERALDRLFELMAKESGSSKKKLETLRNDRSWVAGMKIDVLRWKGLLSDAQYGRITGFRTARNDFIHKGIYPSRRQAEEALSFVREIVERVPA